MTEYTKGDVVTLKSGSVWLVRDARPHSDGSGRIVVGLVEPDHLNHGTAFSADNLDNAAAEHRRGPLPEERFTTSVRDEGTYVYDVIKQTYVLHGARFDEASAARRAGELNAEWQQQVLSQF